MCFCSVEWTQQVLCEVLAGIDSEVIVSLLRDAVDIYTRGEETGRREGSGEMHAARRAGIHTRPVLGTNTVRIELVVHPHRVEVHRKL